MLIQSVEQEMGDKLRFGRIVMLVSGIKRKRTRNPKKESATNKWGGAQHKSEESCSKTSRRTAGSQTGLGPPNVRHRRAWAFGAYCTV